MMHTPRGGRCTGWITIALLALTMTLTGCHKKSGATGEAASGQKTFASPNDAAKALVEAARSDNQPELLSIFGSDAKDVIDSGNATEDRTSLAGFAAAYDRMNRWRTLDDGKRLLLVGASNTAFPIPLRQDRHDQWYFDVPAGREEILARRIGRNELAAIDILASLADAQQEYYLQAHDGLQQYARKMISDPGKQNGLYWPSAAGQPKSPIGPLLAFASPEGRKDPNLYHPFHGYYFHGLLRQGVFAVGGDKDYVARGKDVMTNGFAFVAYPADYGKSGIMTFLINRDRIIYQKDLGERTVDIANSMSMFGPDGSWSQVKQ